MKLYISKNFLHHKNQIGLSNLVKFLNIELVGSIQEADVIYSPSEPLNTSKYKSKKFIFGPHFSVFPNDKFYSLKNKYNSIYILPCDWCIDFWKNHFDYNSNINLPIISVPFPVDTENFKPIESVPKTCILIYMKHRKREELNFLIQKFENISNKIVLFEYGKYNENNYKETLHKSKYGIWLDAHESQGFALQEALSCNVPLLVWNTTNMSQEFGSTYSSDYKCTTIPYWDERCGEYFYNQDEFDEKYKVFISKLDSYKPREFIMENLDVKSCYEKYWKQILNINKIKNYTEEDIKNEIKINGNTNLITDSGLSSGAQIHAIGDSHTIFFYNSMKIIEHWFCNHNLPLTIYRLLNEELDIYKIGTILGNSHEKYNIKKDDYVIFFFGFNDIQRNIHLHHSNRWRDEIIFLMNEYIKKIIFYKKKYNIKTIITCIYPNPRPDALGQNPSGTYEDRRNYTLFANEVLKKLCDINCIKYLDIYENITDMYGFIKKEVTKDSIHLDYDNQHIREFVENEIFKLCVD